MEGGRPTAGEIPPAAGSLPPKKGRPAPAIIAGKPGRRLEFQKFCGLRGPQGLWNSAKGKLAPWRKRRSGSSDGRLKALLRKGRPADGSLPLGRSTKIAPATRAVVGVPALPSDACGVAETGNAGERQSGSPLPMGKRPRRAGQKRPAIRATRGAHHWAAPVNPDPAGRPAGRDQDRVGQPPLWGGFPAQWRGGFSQNGGGGPVSDAGAYPPSLR